MSRLLTSEELTRQVADVAEQMQHHPDIDVRWTTTRWSLSTHSAGALSQLDIELAHRLADTARRTGALHERETPS